MSDYDVWVIALRAASLVAAIQAAGMVVFLCLFDHQIEQTRSRICRYVMFAVSAGIILTLAQHLLTPTRMTATLSGAWDISLQTMLLQSDAGIAHGVRLVGLLLLPFIFRRRFAITDKLLGVSGIFCIVVSFLLMGHTASHGGWLLTMALGIHIMVITFWFGALVPLYVVAAQETDETCVAIMRRFSAMAVWLVPLIALAGLSMALLLLSSFADLLAPYGILLIVKTTLFAVLMLFAALNKWRFTPAIATGDSSAKRGVKRTITLEWVCIVAVVFVTAFMTGLFMPTS